MRDPKRIDKILKRLGDAWKKHPDLRLGQIIFNVLYGEGVPFKIRIFNTEDNELIQEIEKYLNNPEIK